MNETEMLLREQRERHDALITNRTVLLLISRALEGLVPDGVAVTSANVDSLKQQVAPLLNNTIRELQK